MAIQYTNEEYTLAKNVSCFDYLVSKGYELERHGQHHKLKEHDSLVLFADGGFKWYSRNISGNAITLLTELERMPINEAVKTLSEFSDNRVRSPTNDKIKTVSKQNNHSVNEKVIEKEQRNLILPEKNTSDKKIKEYLTETRKISSDVVDYAITNNLVYQDKNGNCIFVGYDENKEPKFATLRGTYDKVFRKDIVGSSKDCGFSSVNKDSKMLYVFESAIDSLSMMAINNSTYDNYLSLNGTSIKSLENFLKNNPNIDTITTCLDNDEAGRNATKKIWDTYKDSYSMKYQNFLAKDVNEQLIMDTFEPKMLIEKSNVNDVSVGEFLSFKEIENILNKQPIGDYSIKAKIFQGDYVICNDLYIDTQNSKPNFRESINEHLTLSLSVAKETLNTINLQSANENVDKKDLIESKLAINNFKNELSQLSKVYKKYISNDNEKDKSEDKSNDTHKSTIRQKVAESEKTVNIVNHRSNEAPIAKTMER